MRLRSATLRSFHDADTVNAVADVLQHTTPALRQESVKALATLYKVEAKWDGGWWTPRPDTRGPYYKSEAWAMTPRVASLLEQAANDPDVPTAKLALVYIGLIEVKEAVLFWGLAKDAYARHAGGPLGEARVVDYGAG